MPKFHVDDKGLILDVRARDQAGKHYNIEVQLRHQVDEGREEGRLTALRGAIREVVLARWGDLSADRYTLSKPAKKWERDRITEMNAAIEEGEARGEARAKAEGRTEALQEVARALRSKGTV